MIGKMKRIASILLVCTLVLTMGILSGCGTKAGAGSTDTVNAETQAAASVAATEAAATEVAEEPQLDPVTLTWYIYRDNTEPDDQMVLDKANEYLKEKLNVTLKLISYGYSEYPERLQLLASAGDKFDL